MYFAYQTFQRIDEPGNSRMMANPENMVYEDFLPSTGILKLLAKAKIKESV